MRTHDLPTDAICGYCGDHRFREREDLIEYGGRGYPDLTEWLVICEGCKAEYRTEDDLDALEIEDPWADEVA